MYIDVESSSWHPRFRESFDKCLQYTYCSLSSRRTQWSLHRFFNGSTRLPQNLRNPSNPSRLFLEEIRFCLVFLNIDMWYITVLHDSHFSSYNAEYVFQLQKKISSRNEHHAPWRSFSAFGSLGLWCICKGLFTQSLVFSFLYFFSVNILPHSWYHAFDCIAIAQVRLFRRGGQGRSRIKKKRRRK